MKTEAKLKIADVIIEMQSKFPLQQQSQEEKKLAHSERYDNFSYKGDGRPDILVNVNIVEKLPKIKSEEVKFITYHFQDRSENWRLLKKGKTHIYKSPVEDKKQVMLVNNAFNRVNAYLLAKKERAAIHRQEKEFIRKNNGYVWSTADIIYDFLQVLLINYFAQRNAGIFTHSIGVKDVDGSGLLFNGKSGAGKSTSAQLWYKHSQAMVLNDDRIIVRKKNGRFFIYGSPWHGAFSDYLKSRIESAPLKKIFFIHHAKENRCRRISKPKAFRLLYPALFPTFWDKECLENIVSFSLDLVKTVPCYNLGFVNDERIIEFVRKVN